MTCLFPRFLKLSTSGFGDQEILYWGPGDCHVYCGMFNSIVGLHPLHASVLLPQYDNQNGLQTLPNALMRQKSPPDRDIENHALFHTEI